MKIAIHACIYGVLVFIWCLFAVGCTANNGTVLRTDTIELPTQGRLTVQQTDQMLLTGDLTYQDTLLTVHVASPQEISGLSFIARSDVLSISMNGLESEGLLPEQSWFAYLAAVFDVVQKQSIALEYTGAGFTGTTANGISFTGTVNTQGTLQTLDIIEYKLIFS